MEEKSRRFDDGMELAPAFPQNAPEVVPYQMYNPAPATAHLPGQHVPYSSPPPPQGAGVSYSPVHTSPTSYTAQTATIGAYSHPNSPVKNDSLPALPAPLPAGEDFDHTRPGSQKRQKRTICGCGVLVFVLCAVIALLGAACIGLAAGTGIEANRANDAREQLALMSASGAGKQVTVTVSATAASATPIGFNELSKGCSNDPNNVSGQSYTAPKDLGAPTFTLHCNKDATGTNLMALFTSSFETCMDACASFTFYEPSNFGATHANATCRSVSFIPLWTDKSKASEGKAPGNCFLKPSGNVSTLGTPNIGTECHAAMLSARR